MKRNTLNPSVSINQKYKKMKIVKFSLMVCLVSVFTLMSSCSKDDGEECHECHIALENANGSETMWHIDSPSGGEEFCGDELEDMEEFASGDSWVYTVTDTLYSECEGMPCVLPPGEYGPGSAANSDYEIHCHH